MYAERTLPIQRVAESILRKDGLDPALAGYSQMQWDRLADLINERVRIAWESEFWPSVMMVERRTYRAAWDNEAHYDTGDEVFHEVDGVVWPYWRRTASLNTGEPGTDDAWENATIDNGFVTRIDFDQSDRTRVQMIDLRNAIYGRNPETDVTAQPYTRVALQSWSLFVTDSRAPAQPYLRFRPYAPQFSLHPWDTDTAYAPGALTYYVNEGVGETYMAIEPNQAKEPYDHIAQWAPVGFPLFLREYVEWAVASDMKLDDEGRFRSEARAEQALDRMRETLLDAPRVSRRAFVNMPA